MWKYSENRIAQHYHISIILSIGAGKHKRGEGYVVQRDQAYGSVAWSRSLEMMAAMNYAGDEANRGRTLLVSHRQAPAESFDLEFDVFGKLREAAPEAEEESPVLTWARGLKPGTAFTRGEAIEAMKKDESGLSPATVKRHIDAMLKARPRKLTERQNDAGKWVLSLISGSPAQPDEPLVSHGSFLGS